MLYNEVMAIQPDTDVYLLKCPIEQDQRNQLTFSNRTAQQAYFSTLPKIALDNFSYQRKDNVIRVPQHIDSIIGYNYVMYCNNNYTNRWFYAFITNMEYVNDNCTHVYIKTDVYQTWGMDLTWKQCFIEREHVSDDTVGAHTLEEELPTGEYIVNAIDEYGITNPSEFAVIVQVSDLPSDMTAAGTNRFKNAQKIYGGLPNGCWLIVMPYSSTYALYESLNALINWYDADGREEAIIAMYVVPKALFPAEYSGFDYDNGTAPEQHGFSGWFIPASTTTYSIGTHSWSRNNTLDGYTPRNNRLLCYPYNYLLITNNGGDDVEYRWEEFSSSNATFRLDALVNQGCDQKLRPTNYKRTNGSGGYEWSVTGQKLPTLSWKSDYYLNWQAKNGTGAAAKQARRGVENFNNAENVLEFASSVGEIIGAGMNGGFGQIKNKFSGAESRAETTPDTSRGNSASGDINFTLGKTCFTGYKMSVRAEVARVIDSYFDRFGYKVLTSKVPNFNTRANWNYVKLIECNVVADIPQTDLDEIKKMFNNGVTLWHNPSTFMDYSQNNNIV